MEFYEAVWEGDIKTVENLTIKKPIGSQVHVASISSFSNRTPLHLAVEKNNSKMLEKLIHIMVKQYTPLAPLIEVKTSFVQFCNVFFLRWKREMHLLLIIMN